MSTELAYRATGSAPPTPRPPNEPGRMAALQSYELLDTPADPRIDVFVRVAAQFYDVPFSMVSLVDSERVWFKAGHGLGAQEVPRENAFCAHAIAQPSEVTVVEDASVDARFASTDLVSGENGFRFYAGAPITTPDGHALGTLCILDQKARTLDGPARQHLADLAMGVGAVLDLHRNTLRLRRAATHDPLTGLGNRALFEPALAQAVEAATVDSPAAVLCIDLDHFKDINDRFGHGGGDTLLRAAAERLRACVRPADLPARLGGDELAVLLRGSADMDAPRTVAERILAAFAEPVRLDGVEVPIRASIGYARAPLDADTGPALMHVADTALYAAKSSGRGRLAGVDKRPNPALPELLDDLRAAIAGGTLDIAWQPYFDLAADTLRGAEALVRWHRPGHGAVPPDTIILLAEEAGLATSLDDWMLRTACQEAACLPGHTEVSVNVSGASFHSPGFIGQVVAALALSRLSSERLVLEIDQRTACHESGLARAVVEELTALGVTVALHNFGTGTSALSCLREVPFGRIKLGQGFVGRLGQEPRTDALIRSLVQMGRALGSSVCAEGIETVAQLAFMRDAGCQLGQGFLLGPPSSSPWPVRDALDA